ncbi:MAG: hypothetical protein AB7I30_13390 [Isosphaeraceae bacterium]
MDPGTVRRSGVVVFLVGFHALATGAGPLDDDPDDGGFGFTPPIVCQEINGFEDYVPLPEPVLTADEKLLLYYRPRHFKTEPVGEKFRAHLTQDARIRRKGRKTVLRSEDAMVDYQVDAAPPPRLLYIRNTVSLKGLSPGEYELDVILHDRIGRSEPATRSVPFRVVLAESKRDPAPPDGPPGRQTDR